MHDTSKIKEHMDGISSDRKTVGKVDHLEGADKIKLTKQSSPKWRASPFHSDRLDRSYRPACASDQIGGGGDGSLGARHQIAVDSRRLNPRKSGNLRYRPQPLARAGTRPASLSRQRYRTGVLPMPRPANSMTRPRSGRIGRARSSALANPAWRTWTQIASSVRACSSPSASLLALVIEIDPLVEIECQIIVIERRGRSTAAVDAPPPLLSARLYRGIDKGDENPSDGAKPTSRFPRSSERMLRPVRP